MPHLEANNIKIYGIVLRNTTTGNGNKLLTVLDRDLGKLDLIAFGSCREKSSRRSSILVSNLISGEASRRLSEHPYSLKEAILIQDFPLIASDLNRLSYLYLIFEILNNLLLQGSPFPLFSDLINAIQLIETSADSRKYAFDFIVRLFLAEGIMPELESSQLGDGSARFIRDILSRDSPLFLKDKAISGSVAADLIDFIRIVMKEQTGKDLSSLELIRIYK